MMTKTETPNGTYCLHDSTSEERIMDVVNGVGSDEIGSSIVSWISGARLSLVAGVFCTTVLVTGRKVG